MTAAWKPGFEWCHKADAQKVADEIISIGESATPKQILEKARDESTELHKVFEWDDTKAAEAYRLSQARQIVCHLVIKETIQENRPAIRFLHKPENGAGYKPTQLIIRNQDSYQALLSSAFRDLEAFKVKYHSLTELETIFEEIDAVTRR